VAAGLLNSAIAGFSKSPADTTVVVLIWTFIGG